MQPYLGEDGDCYWECALSEPATRSVEARRDRQLPNPIPVSLHLMVSHEPFETILRRIATLDEFNQISLSLILRMLAIGVAKTWSTINYRSICLNASKSQVLLFVMKWSTVKLLMLAVGKPNRFAKEVDAAHLSNQNEILVTFPNYQEYLSRK